MTRLTRLLLGTTLLLASVALPARGQQAATRATPTITVSALNTTAAAEVASKARGTPRTTVQPGDVLRYTLTFTNSSERPVRNVELRDPIPEGVRYVAGSARSSRADARLEFSVDGGQTWAAQPTETVVVAGQRVTRPVPADRYTHVRWTVTGAVAPNATVTADFDARVNGAGA